MNRRGFIAGALGGFAGAACWRVSPRAPEPEIVFGYAALTWRGDDRQAIDDISALGFRGIQLRASAVREWGDRPEDLRALLTSRRLTMVALSSGVVRIDPAHEAEDLAVHQRNARFVRDVGGLYLQVVDERPRGRAITNADYTRMGRLLTELGRRTADLGVALGYHNHMGNLGQSPEEVARVLDAADPRFVRLELDTAHYRQGGGDPAAAVRQFAGRLLFLHVKDVVSPVPGGEPSSYRFVELGRGQVDFPALFEALATVRYAGWAIVELDPVPNAERTPRESGALSRAYLESLGFTI
jgi:inosose dehydratase